MRHTKYLIVLFNHKGEPMLEHYTDDLECSTEAIDNGNTISIAIDLPVISGACLNSGYPYELHVLGLGTIETGPMSVDMDTMKWPFADWLKEQWSCKGDSISIDFNTRGIV